VADRHVASEVWGVDAFLGVSDPFDLSRLMKRDRCSASAVGADLAASASRWNPTRFNRSSSSSPAPICSPNRSRRTDIETHRYGRGQARGLFVLQLAWNLWQLINLTAKLGAFWISIHPDNTNPSDSTRSFTSVRKCLGCCRAYKDYLADRSTWSTSAVTFALSDNEANDAVPFEGWPYDTSWIW